MLKIHLYSARNFVKDSENNESRVFTCMDGCDATVKINLGTLVLEEEGQHSCPVSLTLELDKDCGIFDGDVFKKNPGKRNDDMP